MIKDKSGFWFKQSIEINTQLTLELNKRVVKLIQRIVKVSGLKYEVELAEQCCVVLLANLWYAYLIDKPLTIHKRHQFWDKLKMVGNKWASYNRATKLLDAMNKLSLVNHSNGFFSKEQSYCSKYWFETLPKEHNNFKVLCKNPIDTIVVADENGPVEIKKTREIQRERTFINKYNDWINQHDIHFNFKLDDLTKDTDKDLAQSLLNRLTILAEQLNNGKISLEMEGQKINFIHIERDKHKKLFWNRADRKTRWRYVCLPRKIKLYINSNTDSSIDIDSTVHYNNTDSTDSVDYTDTERIYTETVKISVIDKDNVLKLLNLFFSGAAVFSSISRRFCHGDYKHGGRFYDAPHETFPAQIRKTLTINGEPVVEPDYSGLHIRMLYHIEDIDFKGECYVYAKEDKEHHKDRERLKLASLIMINAKTKDTAKSAIHEQLKGLGLGFDKHPMKNVEALMKKFEEHHQPISKYLYSNKGVELQFLDSEIMLRVLKELYKKDIAVLPIHDSIAIPKKHEELAKQIMMEEYKDIMGYYPVI